MIPSKGPFFCMKSYTYDTVSSKSVKVSAVQITGSSGPLSPRQFVSNSKSANLRLLIEGSVPVGPHAVLPILPFAILTLVNTPVTGAQPPCSRSGLGRLFCLLGSRRRGKVIESLVPRHVGLLNDDRRLQEHKLGILACLSDRTKLIVSSKCRGMGFRGR